MSVFGDDLAKEVGRRYGAPVQMMQLRHGIFDEASISVIASGGLRKGTWVIETQCLGTWPSTALRRCSSSGENAISYILDTRSRQAGGDPFVCRIGNLQVVDFRAAQYFVQWQQFLGRRSRSSAGTSETECHSMLAAASSVFETRF